MIYTICAGIDVHKNFMSVAIITTKSQGIYETQHKSFSTMINGIEAAMHWLLEQDCHVVVMESTGKYRIPVFNLMEDSFQLTLANPYFTKTFPGNKTDRRDAQWLNSLKTRRGHNKAVMAVCRSILIAIYNMLSKNEPFKEMSEPSISKRRAAVTFLEVSDDTLLQELIKRGYQLVPVT